MTNYGYAAMHIDPSHRILRSMTMPPKTDFNPSKNRYCMIGEADPFLARLLQRFAEKSGLQIQRAQTGDEFLALVQADRPALMILEPELPGKLRGWEAVQVLRSEAETRDIPIILCAWLKEADACALVGQVFPHLQKPDLHYEDFAAALRTAGINLAPGESEESV
jgi:CheY-like chemotaxis protein